MALLVFFLSGFAALLYQVIWQRLLVLFSGADVYSITIIVAAFMAGLGLGNFAGGNLADRWGARGSLWGFALAELLVGVFGFFSSSLYYDVLYLQVPQLAASPARAAIVLFASLVIPTFLMGVSLPLLARAMTGSLAAAGRVVGSLYGWNTLGAATGAFVSTWVLVPRYGLERSLAIGAGVNLACAAAAATMGVLRFNRIDTDHERREPTDVARSGTADGPLTVPFRLWVFLFGLTGFIALGLEITWFRLLGVMLKSTAFTFGTLLTVYLAGLGLGGALGARAVERNRRPGATFLALQYAATLYAAFSVAALIALVGQGHPERLVLYLGGYEPLHPQRALSQLLTAWSDPGQMGALLRLATLYILVPAALVGPPTFLMGLSFPCLQKASQSDLRMLGRRLGALLASNIVGAVLGTVVTGWILLPVVGTAGTMKVLVGLGVLLSWPLRSMVPSPRMLVPAAAALITAVAVIVIPDSDTLWARLHAAEPRDVLSAEDGSGLSLLKSKDAGFRDTVTVFVNGLGQSWIPYGDVHTLLGVMPALIHPSPAHVLIIGLGSGDTAFSAAGRREVERVTCIEIIGAQLDTLERLSRVRQYGGLTTLLTDPRIEHREGDGRVYLLHASRRFDIIEADALRPTSAYAGNLYSREYFDLLRRRLAPGGMAVTWAPTERTRQTFLSVFPHVLAFGVIYIGSNSPIAFDADAVLARTAAARDYFRAAGIDIESLVHPLLAKPPRVFGPGDARTTTDLNTDLFPRDEFSLP